MTFEDHGLAEPPGGETTREQLARLSNDELIEELTLHAVDVPDGLWQEIGMRLGVSGLLGLRVTNRWMPQAERLRRYHLLWEGQPEKPCGEATEHLAGRFWQD